MSTSIAVKKEHSWLNRNVLGMTLTSFLSDFGHEMVTAVLPGFLGVIGVAAAALGWIEGVADAASSFIKLGAGWYSDRIGHSKGIVTLGYLLTGTALAVFALAVSWPLILLGRVVSWFGRGIRGPLRDAMLAESVDASVRGKAFGLHRAGDTAGAVIGPLVGVALLQLLPVSTPSFPFQTIFVLSLIPGIGSAIAFALLIRETRRAPNRQLRLWHTIRELPHKYRIFLEGVGLFGLGDFSHTLLILAATQVLTPAHGPIRAAQLAALLYVVRNVLYTLASLPIGVLGDRAPNQQLLAGGYLIGVLTALMTAYLLTTSITSVAAWTVVFSLAGIYIAAQDALEGAIPAELVRAETRGTAYGVLGTVNGIGDLVASVLVGTLWTAASPWCAFGTASALMFAGTLLMLRNSRG